VRSQLINAIVAVISVLLTLATIEIGLRLTGSYAPPSEPIRNPQPELFQADESIGYRLKPCLRTTHFYPRSSSNLIPVVSNSDGFRSSRELDQPDTRKRILIVGDSFAYGLGVREEDRLAEQLELLQPQWRVDTLAMPGWGLDLMVRAIEQYGRKAHPDVVVLAIYTDDFRRLHPYYAGEGFAYSKFKLNGSDLITVPFPRPGFWESLRFVQLLYRATWRQTRNRYDLNGALLERFLNNSETIGFRPVVVFIPAIGDFKEDKQRRGFLHDWTSRNAVPYMDLTGAIQREAAKNAYIRGNVHWSPAGHQIAAKELQQVLSGIVGLDQDHATALVTSNIFSSCSRVSASAAPAMR
jgi:hypothetical protein